MKIELRDFYYEFCNHYDQLVKALYEVNADGAIQVGIKLDVDLDLITLLQMDFQLLKELQLKHIDASSKYIQLKGGEDLDHLRIIDFNFLHHTVSPGGSLYNMAAYDVDEETKYLYDSKYSADLRSDNYGDCMGAAFNEAINEFYNLHNIFEYDADKIISEMKKTASALEEMILESGDVVNKHVNEQWLDESAQSKLSNEEAVETTIDNNVENHQESSEIINALTDVYHPAKTVKELYKRMDIFYKLIVNGIYDEPENQELVVYEPNVEEVYFRKFQKDFLSFSKLYKGVIKKYENTSVDELQGNYKKLYQMMQEIDLEYMDKLISEGGVFNEYISFDMSSYRDDVFYNQLAPNLLDPDVGEKMGIASSGAMDRRVEIRDAFCYEEPVFMRHFEKLVNVLEFASSIT
ncbi:hypothetical protein [Butyrivibrio sp. AE2005]|uniref:hypothetical protein n=1 Tax=Butyrivibrio sp. AE2005 TaxID=1496722 RepID=UPI00047DA0AC|nr:hypothetical protein [Butyrivibrio sp. AE2005]